jgi:hypothetical protein
MRENKCKSVTKSCKLSDLIVVQHQGVYGVFNFLFTLFFLLSVVSFASPTQEVLGGLQRDVMILEKRQYLGNIGSLWHLNSKLLGLLSLFISLLFRSWVESILLSIFLVFLFFDWLSLTGPRSFFPKGLDVLQLEERKVKGRSIVLDLARCSSLGPCLPGLGLAHIILLHVEDVVLLLLCKLFPLHLTKYYL